MHMPPTFYDREHKKHNISYFSPDLYFIFSDYPAKNATSGTCTAGGTLQQNNNNILMVRNSNKCARGDGQTIYFTI
jgi:hypothetical protein